MEDRTLAKSMWNEAGKAGLAMGVVSTIYLFATQFLGKMEIPVFLNMLLTTVLWAAKFGGCIWLMMFFMKKFAVGNPEVDNKGTRRFGTVAALLSAIVYAAISFANIAFISPDLYTEQMDMVMQQMAPMMDSNTMAEMEKTMQNLPQFTFISTLIYCFLYGAILSAILSKNIPSRDPFADYRPEEH